MKIPPPFNLTRAAIEEIFDAPGSPPNHVWVSKCQPKEVIDWLRENGHDVSEFIQIN